MKSAVLREALVRAKSNSRPAATKTAASSKLDPTLAQRLPLRVLLCDDNLVNQKVAQRLLQQMGYRADLVANGAEAIAALDHQTYDLIFMDLLMPEVGGLEATQVIRQRQKQPAVYPNYKSPLIIIAMTASAMQGDREKCLAAGMDDYLAKPVRPEDVRAIIERWGAIAARMDGPAQPPSKAQSSPAAPCSRAPTVPAPDAAPVDLPRLLEFTDGTPENLRELVTLYLNQTGQQMEQLQAAVAAARANDTRRLAHSAAGASGTCGARRLCALLRQLEGLANEEKLENVPQLAREIGAEFESVRAFLHDYLAQNAEPASKP